MNLRASFVNSFQDKKASGAKLIVQLLGEMRRRKSRYGMVTMCVGGGQGAATIFENLQS